MRKGKLGTRGERKRQEQIRRTRDEVDEYALKEERETNHKLGKMGEGRQKEIKGGREREREAERDLERHGQDWKA